MLLAGGDTCLGGRASHAAAFFGAALASLGALLAVVVLVLTTLGGTSVARLSANAADVVGQRRVPTHQRGSRPAKRGAIAVAANAFRHHGDVVLLQAGSRTVLASLSTAHAGFDTVVEFVADHG